MASASKSKRKPKPEIPEWKRYVRVAQAGRLVVIKKQDKEKLRDVRNENGTSLLHFACKFNYFENVKYLIEEVGCDLNVKNKFDITPLECALRSEYPVQGDKIVKLLLKSVDLLSSCKSRIFNFPTIAKKLGLALMDLKGGAKETASYLLEKGWGLDDVAHLQDKEITLHFFDTMPERLHYTNVTELSISSDVMRFRETLKHAAHSKRITSWALINASASKKPESPFIIQLLLDAGAPVNGFLGDPWRPLSYALFHCNVQNSRILFEQGARLFDLRVYNCLREKMRHGNDPRAEACIRLIFEYRGIWRADSDKNSMRLAWVTGHLPSDLPILNLLFEYLSKEPAANFFPSNSYKFFNNCKKEILEMKACKVKGSLNLYQLLMKKTNQLVAYTRDKSLMEKIESLRIQDKFIVHGAALQSKLELAMEKRLLIDKSERILYGYLGHLCLDRLVIRKVVKYMGVPNLLCYEEKKN